MGDCTSVTLTVLREHAETTKVLLKDTGGPSDGVLEAGEETHFYFDEVNHATLNCESALITAGIAYDKTWQPGGEYGAGLETVRFTADGDVQQLEIYDEDRNPDLQQLLNILDTTPRSAQRLARLTQHIREHAAKVTPLPWDHQAEYGKIYRARKLLDPT